MASSSATTCENVSDDWRQMADFLRDALSKEGTTIAGLSVAAALKVHETDTWAASVKPGTVRYATYKLNFSPDGINRVSVETSRDPADGLLPFRASDFATLSMPEGHTLTLDDVLLTLETFLAFCFSVERNKNVFNVFVEWFNTLDEPAKLTLFGLPLAVQALSMNIAWILANRGDKHTLKALDFDPVVRAVGTHHELPTLAIITECIKRFAAHGFCGNLDDIPYAARYIEVRAAGSPETAGYIKMDETKFKEFAALAYAL